MWVLPTYKRPDKCQAVLKAIKYVGNSSPGLIVVNGTEDAVAYQKMDLPPNWSMAILPQNIGVCGAMNWAFNRYPNEPFYGLICDDEYVYSTGWDKTLIDAAGAKNVSHGNDKWQSGKRMHAYVTWGGDLIRHLGWWALPGLWHWYHDNVWELLMQGTNAVKFCDTVHCEHKHYLAGKTVKDATYTSGESRAMQDQAIFQQWVMTELPRVRQKLSEFYSKP
jgi:hypothetical protein